MRTWGGDASQVVITTKGGITRGKGEQWGRDGSMAYLRSAVEKSLRELGVEAIDLYQYHRPDRSMVYGDVVQNLAELKREGKVREIGISNASVEEIEIAQRVLGDGNLVSVQNEFLPRHPGSHDELRYCEKHGITFLPWSPLGGTGGGARQVGDRFSVFREVGERHGVSPQQVVLAWELSLSPVLVAIPGARRPASITDSAAAVELELTADERERGAGRRRPRARRSRHPPGDLDLPTRRRPWSAAARRPSDTVSRSCPQLAMNLLTPSSSSCRGDLVDRDADALDAGRTPRRRPAACR